MDLEAEQPGWLFYFGWIVLSTLAILLAFGGAFLILALAVNWIGDWIVVDGQKHITEDYLFGFVFLPLIWLFTSGLQFALLRRYLPKIGRWIPATALGWILAVTAIYLVSLGLGRINFSAWGIGFPVIGVVIGISQWLVLRSRLPQTGWWILASLLGWGLIDPLVGMPFTSVFDILSLGLFPALTTAICWWFLFRQQAKESQQLIDTIKAEV